MERQEFYQDISVAEKSAQGFNIDYKRVLFHAVRYWYLIALSLALALLFAYLKNRYATRIYPVTASIIIKDAEDVSGGELLYNNPLVSYHRNYLNEPYILRSYPLIESVLTELNFAATFHKEGNFLTTEVYEYLPVSTVILDEPEIDAASFVFTLSSNNSYLLKPLDDQSSGEEAKEFQMHDTVRYAGLRLVFKPIPEANLQPYVNHDFIFNYKPVRLLSGAYVKKLDAQWAEEGSGVVNLNINGANPRKEIDFLAGLIKRYQEYDLEKKNQTASRTVSFINDQLDGITDSLRHVETQLERFKNQNVVTDLTGEALRIYQKLEDLESQKSALIISNNYYTYLTDYITKNQDVDQVILPTSVGITDPILTSLITKMIEIQFELKLMKRSENPLTNDARRRITEMKKDIVESVRNLRSTDKIKSNFLDQQIKAIEKQLDYLPVAERRLVSIERNYSLLENLYIFLLQKRSEAAISQAANTSDIVVVNPPMLAGGPISPKTGQNFVIAALLGLALPIVGFVFIEVLNTRVQSKEDVEKITSIPFIGGVGHKRSQNNLEVLTHPKTSIAESFRALRSNLNYFVGKQEQGIFLITSSISGEGKTFTSVNLASVLALSGKRTLIVGADMRRPRIFDDFNLKNEVGLSSYLADLATLDQVVQETKFSNLDLISGGPVPPNPSELLLTERMQVFMNDIKTRYDYIILDTPPLAIVADALALASFADHTLFLVRQNYTPKDFLKTVDDFYSNGRLKNISIVLNDIHKSGPGYGYGYGYGYTYGYTDHKNGFGYYSEP